MAPIPSSRRAESRPPARAPAVVVVVASLALTAVLGLLAAGCSSGPDPDREQAVRDVLALDPRLTRGQAECYVDRVTAELGPGALSPGSSVPPEQITRLTSIRVDCIGVANLGTDPPTTIAPTSQPGDTVPGETRPERPGDDPALDALYRSCGAGDGAACDRLFDEAPLGSEYERFGSTCGDRTKELRCADVYGSSTSSSTPSPSAAGAAGAQSRPGR